MDTSGIHPEEIRPQSWDTFLLICAVFLPSDQALPWCSQLKYKETKKGKLHPGCALTFCSRRKLPDLLLLQGGLRISFTGYEFSGQPSAAPFIQVSGIHHCSHTRKTKKTHFRVNNEFLQYLTAFFNLADDGKQPF